MALLLAMFLAPCIGQAGPPREATSSSGAQAHDDSAWVAQAVDRLIRRNSADSLVAAAMLSRSGAGGLSSGHRRVQLLDRAAALQPLAADIAALLVRVCHDDDVAGCNMAAHVERLHRAAPDNAGYLRPALHRARQQHDSGKVTTILLRMAQASSFESYCVPVQQRIWRGIQSIALPPPAGRMGGQLLEQQIGPRMTLTIFAIARLQALSMGGSVIRACKSQNPAFAQRQSACRHLGELLSHSSDYVSDIIGLVVWRDAAAGAAERLELERRISRLKWLMFHALNLLQSGEPTLTERFLDVLAQGSEVRGVEALLAAHGLPTQPPADWVENAAHRHARTSHASR